MSITSKQSMKSTLALFFAGTTLALASTANLPASAAPVTLHGRKGTYIVDIRAGTYYGCIKGSGCISLGPNHRVGGKQSINHAAWQNGDYTYKLTETRVVVDKNGTTVFSDHIIN